MRRNGRAWLPWVLLALLLAAPAARAELVVMRVVVNGMDQGDRIFELTSDGDVLLSLRDYADLGFDPPAPQAASPYSDRVSLQALSPRLGYGLDGATSTLFIEAHPRLFRSTVLYFSHEARQPPPREGEPAAILNAYPEVWYREAEEEAVLRLPAELTLSADRYVFTTDYLYSRDGEDRSVRLMSHLTMDDPGGMERLRLGDVAASSGRLGGAAVMGGVSLRRAFFMQPYFRPFSGSEYVGSTLTPARVEVWVNDVYLGAQEVPPGEFQVRGLPVMSGTGNMRIVVTDRSGNRREIEGTYYATNRLLKEGLDDYQYSVGWLREGLGVESFGYGKPLLMAQHRRGFDDQFTGGMNLEASRDRANLGGEATFLVDGVGEMSLAAAASWQEGEEAGGAWLADFLHQRPGFSVDGSLKYRSRFYSHQSLEAADDKARWEGRAGGSVWLEGIGTLGLGATVERLYEEPDRRRQDAVFQWTLGRGYTLVLRGSRLEEGGDASWEGYAALRGTFGGWTWAADHSRETGGNRQSLQVRRTPRDETGFGFEAAAARTDADGAGVDGSGSALIDYRGTKGTVFAGYRRVGEENFYGGGGGGALVWIDGSLYLTRPVYDAFALVRLEGLENVRVYRNNILQGRTDEQGELLVTGLASYAKNSVSVEDKDIPIRYSVDSASDSFVPRYRSGVLAQLPVKRLQAAVGRFVLVSGGERRPAGYGRIEVTAEGKTRRSVLGRGGEFYLEDLAEGDYDVEVTLDGVRCRTRMTVAPSEEMFVDVGEVECEVP